MQIKEILESLRPFALDPPQRIRPRSCPAIPATPGG